VWLRPGGYLIVYDEFLCRDAHDLELNFQFGPGELRLVGDSTATYGDHLQCAWTGPMRLTPQVHHGGSGPHEGWIAPSLGVRVAAPRLTLTGRIGAGSSVMTVITSPDITPAAHVSIVASGTMHVGTP